MRSKTEAPEETQGHRAHNEVEERIRLYGDRLKTDQNARMGVFRERERLMSLNHSIKEQTTSRCRHISQLITNRNISRNKRKNSLLLSTHSQPTLPSSKTRLPSISLALTKPFYQNPESRYQQNNPNRGNVSNKHPPILRHSQSLMSEGSNIHPEKELRNRIQQQIVRIKKRKVPVIEKFHLLKRMHQNCLSRDLQRKLYGLDLESEVNIARAELYLAHPF